MHTVKWEPLAKFSIRPFDKFSTLYTIKNSPIELNVCVPIGSKHSTWPMSMETHFAQLNVTRYMEYMYSGHCLADTHKKQISTIMRTLIQQYHYPYKLTLIVDTLVETFVDSVVL